MASGPILTKFGISQTVDVSSGGSIAVSLGEDVNGPDIHNAYIYFDKPFNDTYGSTSDVDFINPRFYSLPGFLSGPQTENVPVTKFNSGTITVTRIALFDDNFNETDYSTADLKAAGFPTTVTFQSGGVDTTPPTLTSVVVPSTIVTAYGDASDGLFASAVDAGSGVDTVKLNLDKPIYTISQVGLSVSNISFVDGAVGVDMQNHSFSNGPVPDSERFGLAPLIAGDYNILSATVTDKIGNSRTYSAAELQALGVNLSFKVDPGIQGTDGPDLLGGTPGDDTIYGRGGGDYLAGGGGHNTFGYLAFSDSPVVTPDAITDFKAGQDKIDLSHLTFGSDYPITVDLLSGGGAEVLVGTYNGRVPDMQINLTTGSIFGSDIVTGQKLHLTLNGSSGDDLLVGSSGNDYIDGAAGFDTLALGSPTTANAVGFSGFTYSGQPLTILGPEGTDTVVNVEAIRFTDGTLFVDGLNTVAFAYEALLGRTPSLGELAFWTSALNAGTATADSLQQVLASTADGQAHLPELISGLYEYDLGRAATGDEVSFWSGQLQSGGADLAALEQVLAGQPGAQAQQLLTVDDLYRTFLGRDSTSDDFYFEARVLGSGQTTLSVLERQLAASDTGGVHEAAAVTTAYDLLIGRDPSAGETAFWVGELGAGAVSAGDLGAILLGTADGQAHTSATITGLYQSDIGRAASGGEVSFWQTRIASGAANYNNVDDLLQTVSTAPNVHALAGTAGADTVSFNSSSGHVVIQGFDPSMDLVRLTGAALAAFDPLAHAVQTTAGDGFADVLVTYDAADTILFKHLALSSLTAADLIHG